MKALLWFCATVVICTAGCGSRDVPQQKTSIREPSWTDHFGTAQGIQDPDERDEAFNSLALDAAADGRDDLVKKAIAEIRSAGKKDQAAHGAAITLAKKGKGEAAREVAKGIADEGMREETLKKIAGFK
jgi:hypothetical protein